jgi:hypothetical protein
MWLSALAKKKRKGWLGGVDERQTDEQLGRWRRPPIYSVESVVDIRARTGGKRCHLLNRNHRCSPTKS